MCNIKLKLDNMTAQKAKRELYEKYHHVIKRLFHKGCYIWGTGLLGKFADEQCKRNNVEVKGFIDNNQEKQDDTKGIFSYQVLVSDDVVIIASFYYPDIMEQLDDLGIKNYIYYEELAYLIEGMSTYYQAFEDVFEELEKNVCKYKEIYDLLQDELSKEIYENIILFRSTLDIKYTQKAWKLSMEEGIQDFDKMILDKVDKEYAFFDVGGFDGNSTLDYIHYNSEYKQIYFFEPDGQILKRAKERLKNNKNIVFVQAGVGERKEIKKYCAVGNGGGFFSGDGTEQVEMVSLDDYVKSHKSYIKMDVEGYEQEALKGAKKCIEMYKPMLSISIYHLPGDIHKLISLILSWNPGYKVYIRHYTKTYADTRAYFIDEG